MAEREFAKVITQDAVLWKEPGGNKHTKILRFGDVVQVIQGWDYNERTWKDKRFVKAMFGSSMGYINVSNISPVKVHR